MISHEEAQRIFDQFGILTNFGGTGLGLSMIADATSMKGNPILALDSGSELPTDEELARINLYLPTLFDNMKDEYLAEIMASKPPSETNWRTLFLSKIGDNDWQYMQAGVQMPWFPNDQMFPRPPWTLDDVFAHIKGIPTFADRHFMTDIVENKTHTRGILCVVCGLIIPIGAKYYFHEVGPKGAFFCSQIHALRWIGHIKAEIPLKEIVLARAVDEYTLAIVFSDQGDNRIYFCRLYNSPLGNRIMINGVEISSGCGFLPTQSLCIDHGDTVIQSDYGKVTLTI